MLGNRLGWTFYYSLIVAVSNEFETVFIDKAWQLFIVLRWDVFLNTVLIPWFKAARDTSFLADTLDNLIRYTNKSGNFAHCVVVGTPNIKAPFNQYVTFLNSPLLTYYSTISDMRIHSTLMLWSRSSNPGSVYLVAFLQLHFYRYKETIVFPIKDD